MVDFLNLPVKEQPKRTLSLSDPEYPGSEFTLTLKRLGSIGQISVSDSFERITKHYSEFPFPAIGGRALAFEDFPEKLIHSACALSMMHVPAEGENQYGPEQFIAMALTMEKAFDELSQAAFELNTLGNAPGAGLQSQGSPDPRASRPTKRSNTSRTRSPKS